MRLLDILHKSAERWRLGLGLIFRKLGYGSKSRRLAEQQATINQLRFQLHEADKELGEVRKQRDLWEANAVGAEQTFSREQLEARLRLATASMDEIKGKLDTALDEHYKKPILTLSEKDALIRSLREEVAFEKAKYAAIHGELADERREHHKQKNATAQMWKFIHTRHRIDQPAERGSVRELLQRFDRP